MKKNTVVILILLFFSMASNAKSQFTRKDIFNLRATIIKLVEKKDFQGLEDFKSMLLGLNWRFSNGQYGIHYYYNDLLDQYKYNELKKILKEWQKIHPKSITPKVYLAALHIKQAWKNRGNKFYSELSESEKKGFIDEALKGWEVLGGATDYNETNDPEYLVHKLKLSYILGRKGGPIRKRLIEKCEKHLYNYFHFYQVVNFFEQKKWSGVAETSPSIAAARAIKLSKNEGHVTYFLLALERAYNIKDKNEYLKFGFNWKLVLLGFEKLDKRYPNDAFAMNGIAALAFFYGEYKTANEIFNILGDNWNAHKKYRWGTQEFYQKVKKMVSKKQL